MAVAQRCFSTVVRTTAWACSTGRLSECGIRGALLRSGNERGSGEGVVRMVDSVRRDGLERRSGENGIGQVEGVGDVEALETGPVCDFISPVYTEGGTASPPDTPPLCSTPFLRHSVDAARFAGAAYAPETGVGAGEEARWRAVSAGRPANSAVWASSAATILLIRRLYRAGRSEREQENRTTPSPSTPQRFRFSCSGRGVADRPSEARRRSQSKGALPRSHPDSAPPPQSGPHPRRLISPCPCSVAPRRPSPTTPQGTPAAPGTAARTRPRPRRRGSAR